MKTKFKIDIKKRGEALDEIIKMITNHNSGLVIVSIDVICGWLLGRQAIYPGANCTGYTIDTEDVNTIHLKDGNDGDYYMSISEVAILELAD